MEAFFILALPRSRTAWLSMFLTAGNTVCMHDAFRLCEKPEDMRTLMESQGRAMVGNSDSFNIAALGDITTMFPDAEIILVHRPVDEVAVSLEKIVMPCDRALLEKCERQILRMRDEGFPYFRFDELGSAATAERLWGIVHKSPFDATRFLTLNAINAQPQYLRHGWDVLPWHIERINSYVRGN